MPAVIIWDDSTDWSDWINEDSTRPTDTRIVGDTFKLPFSETLPTVTEEIARWRFGENQNLSEPLGNTASSQHGAQISENGLLLPTKNSHVIVNEASNFIQPAAGTVDFFLSCWFKSSTVDYSSGIGIIAGFTAGASDGEIEYAIGINTDNQIKGFLTNNGTGFTVEVPVAHADVPIDTNWHFALLGIGSTSALPPTAPTAAALYIDNNITLNQTVAILGGIIFDSSIAGVEFAIGSSESSDANGFAGIVDDVHAYTAAWATPTSLRFESNTFLSPVVDTEKSDSILSSILSEFEIPNSSRLTFSFRASNESFAQNSIDVTWTNFTAPNQIVSGTEADISDLGVFVEGQYHQMRVKLEPSDSSSSSTDPLQLETPVIMSLKINTSRPISLLTTSVPAYNPGTILQQVASFSGDRTIHKVSLDLSITAKERRTFVVGKAGTASFQAANFQDSRDDWIFQPVIHSWVSSGMTIENTYQNRAYASVSDALVNAPYLHYDIFFPEGGSYDLWGYGYTNGDGGFWGFDHDTSHLRRLSLGLDTSGWIGTPRWTRFGNIYLEEGGTHGFTVYLGDLDSVIFDQWYFTTNTRLDDALDDYSDAGYELPLPLSKSPFNTAMRLRSLEDGEIYDLEDPPVGATSITAWGTSADKAASGQFNYAVRNSIDEAGVTFSDGLSIEYWQIGGDRDNFAAWDFRFD